MDNPIQQAWRFLWPPARAGADVTAFDVWKTIAIVLMVVDHIGYFFFPFDMPWRAFGRASAPIWFYLAGYGTVHGKLDKPWPWHWLAWGALVDVLGYLIYPPTEFLPLSIPFTIFAIRFAVPIIKRLFEIERTLTLWLLAAFVAMGVLTDHVFEYGTLAIVVAFAATFEGRQRLFWTLGAGVAYAATEMYAFGFSPLWAGVETIAVLSVLYLLSQGMPSNVPAFVERLPDGAKSVMRWCGRYSLQFYALHFLALAAIARVIML